MTKNIINKYMLPVLLLAVALTGCKKDFTNPNDVPGDQVFEGDRTATGVAVGLQRSYSTTAAGSLYTIINANGFLSNEFQLRNAGNIGELQFSTGGAAVDGTNNVLTNIWTNSNKLIFDANNVIEYSKTTDDPNYGKGLLAYVSIFKALAIGNLATYWEKVPDTIGQNVPFISRIDGYKKAITVIDNALNAINGVTIPAIFTARIPADVDVKNTLLALKARYALFAGDYALALATANLVSLSAKSTLSFNAVNQNPVFESATSTNNVFQPVDSTLGLPPAVAPDLADKRIPFLTGIDLVRAPKYRIKGFYGTLDAKVPLYLPGEIILIKAEALARQAVPDLGAALTELNKVVTKKPADDIYGLGADLPAIVGPLSQADLLTQIYRNRSIELFMTGMKLEDMRRFNRPQAERKRSFLPYPIRERDNNPNTPADPAF